MKKIRKHINRLSVAEPDAKKLWQQIEARLIIDGLYSELNRSSLEKAIQNLPSKDPQRDIWQKIEKGIAVHEVRKNFRVHDNRLVRIAATILLLLISYAVIRIILPEIRQHELDTLKKQPVESFLATLCTRYPKKCQEPDFIELKTEIIRLNDEKSEIENSMFFNPEDASISKITDRIDIQMTTLRTQIMDYVE
jgi:predicted transcriptional regulator